MELKDITAEQMEKAKACVTAEELFALAKEEGVALSDEELQGVFGGSDTCRNVEGCAWLDL